MTLDQILTLERPLIGLDLETTGTNPQTAGIVELGLEIMRPGKPTKEYRTLVNPGFPIPASATAVHHITDEMVKDAPNFGQLAQNLFTGLTGCDFAGYNVRFDLRQLAESFKRVQVPWTYQSAYVVDAFRLWQVVEARSLEDAIDYWIRGKTKTKLRENGVLEDFDGQAHTALWDVKWATRVIAAQLETVTFLPRTLPALHELCWPDWEDAEGKFKWRDGELCFTFGQHRDKPIRSELHYLKWMIKSDFSDYVKTICRETVAGNFRRRALQTSVVHEESSSDSF